MITLKIHLFKSIFQYKKKRKFIPINIKDSFSKTKFVNFHENINEQISSDNPDDLSFTFKKYLISIRKAH